MKRAFTLLFSILLALSATLPAAAATLRATNKVDMTVSSNSIVRTETPLSMENGELVTINCTFSPRTADEYTDWPAIDAGYYSSK